MHGDSDADLLCWVGVYAMPTALLAADLVWSRVQPRWWHLAASGGIFLAFLCALLLALAFRAPLTLRSVVNGVMCTVEDAHWPRRPTSRLPDAVLNLSDGTTYIALLLSLVLIVAFQLIAMGISNMRNAFTGRALAE